jgi:hypothetical protein
MTVFCFRLLLVGYVILANKAIKMEQEFVDQNYIYSFTLPHVLDLHLVFRDISPITMLLKQNFTIKDTVWGRTVSQNINCNETVRFRTYLSARNSGDMRYCAMI